jgi:hypothetical protein
LLEAFFYLWHCVCRLPSPDFRGRNEDGVSHWTNSMVYSALTKQVRHISDVFFLFIFFKHFLLTKFICDCPMSSPQLSGRWVRL